jgi:hydrogenase nickel incorporation protein HypB
MCTTCGCSGDTHAAHHGHAHGHAHAHADARDGALLEKNDRQAAANRRWLADQGVVALNLVSSPGAGKTTLLERTIRDLRGELEVHVIEGDQATSRDADRIQAAGSAAVQINTGTGCHLDAEMVARGLLALPRPVAPLVVIENVGNLVCPALFDLGERAKVLVASVTEGDDKPLKYPHMFRASRMVLLNKIDLLPHVAFDVDRFRDHARAVNAEVKIVTLSATRGDGLAEWYDWIRTGALAGV